MKFVRITHTFTPDEAGHWNLCIETPEDLMVYKEIDGNRNALSAWGFWGRAKRAAKKGYDVFHTSQGDYGINRLMAHRLHYAGKDTTLFDYCSQVDEILIGKYHNMMRMLIDGEHVRTVWQGGYSPMSSFVIKEEATCDSASLALYLSTGRIDESVEINKGIVVFENSDVLSDNLIEFCYRKYGWRGVQRICNLRAHTMGWGFKDYYEFFRKGFENGLHTIILETTMQDEQQFSSIRSVVRKVMDKDFPANKLDVYIKLNTSGKRITGGGNIKIHMVQP